MSTRNLWQGFKYLLLLVIISGTVLGAIKHQDIYDWWRLRNYIPPARIVEIADGARMSELGRKLFYVHKPELNGRDEFNRNCSGFEQTIILGCYITHWRIYIFDVNDPRLDGIEEVTAAHEMLHAAYDRLSSAEKSRIDKLTAEYYSQMENERVKKVVESYREQDPSSVPNELHSILPTEVLDLGPELEQYYAKYFINRQEVVHLSLRYEAVFTQQQERIALLANEIASLQNQLNTDKVTITNFENNIKVEAERLEALRAGNNVEEYNAAVPGYNQMIRTYRNLISAYNNKVKRLNALITEHNHLAVEQKDLINSISSREPEL